VGPLAAAGTPQALNCGLAKTLLLPTAPAAAALPALAPGPASALASADGGASAHPVASASGSAPACSRSSLLALDACATRAAFSLRADRVLRPTLIAVTQAPRLGGMEGAMWA